MTNFGKSEAEKPNDEGHRTPTLAYLAVICKNLPSTSLLQHYVRYLVKLYVYGLPNVRRSNDSVTCQLPYMKLMNGQDAVDVVKETALNGVHLNMCRDRLKQYESGLRQKRPHRPQDEHD